MRLLSDCPAETASFFGPARWTAGQSRGLRPQEAEIWQALQGSPEPSVATVADSGPAPFWALAVVQREASRSQYDALHEALGRGLALPGPTACIALSGRSFHGQRGRPWVAQRGNLFLTVTLAPRAPVEHLVPGLTMLPAVAVADAIEVVGEPGAEPGIKWVNDIMIGGRKVGGVLTATHVRGTIVESAVLGIGVNVATAPRLEPTPFVPEAGCVRDVATATDAGTFGRQVLDGLARRYRELLDRGPGPLLEAYRSLSVVLGRRVRLCEEGSELDGSGEPVPLVVGIVRSIEPDLSLRLEGRAEPVRRGRLFLEPATAASSLRSCP